MCGPGTQTLFKVLFSKDYRIWAYFIPLVSVNTHTEASQRHGDCLAGLFCVLVMRETLTEACFSGAPSSSVPFGCDAQQGNRDGVPRFCNAPGSAAP